MLENIISGLILTSISSLAFIAYKHPQEYKKLLKPLEFLFYALMIAMAVYQFGFYDGKTGEMSFSIGWSLIGVTAFFVFSQLLVALSILTNKEKGKKE